MRSDEAIRDDLTKQKLDDFPEWEDDPGAEQVYGYKLKRRPKRHFKGFWIPKILLDDPKLDALDVMLLAEIDALDDGVEGCFASNKHFALRHSISEGSAANRITKLRQTGYIQDIKFDGRQRWICVPILRRTVNQPSLNHESSLHESMKIKAKANVELARKAEQIYSAYPRKAERPRAIGAIKAALKKIDFDTLLAKTKAFADAVAGAERRFIKHPATWFNNECWNDEVAEWATAKPRPQADRFAGMTRQQLIFQRTRRIDEKNRQFRAHGRKLPPELAAEREQLDADLEKIDIIAKQKGWNLRQ